MIIFQILLVIIVRFHSFPFKNCLAPDASFFELSFSTYVCLELSFFRLFLFIIVIVQTLPVPKCRFQMCPFQICPFSDCPFRSCPLSDLPFTKMSFFIFPFQTYPFPVFSFSELYCLRVALFIIVLLQIARGSVSVVRIFLSLSLSLSFSLYMYVYLFV